MLREWLTKADFSAIIHRAERQKRVLSFLTALTYDHDRLVSWRAVEALGMAAARIAEDDPEYVRIHLRRLSWLLNDESGGIGWRAPEAMGEIICRRPELFDMFIPFLFNLMDSEPKDAIQFRTGWLWAIGRLASVRPSEAQAAMPWILPCLEDPDPQVCGMALWCLGQLGKELPDGISRAFYKDRRQVEIYSNQQIIQQTIGGLASKLNR